MISTQNYLQSVAMPAHYNTSPNPDRSRILINPYSPSTLSTTGSSGCLITFNAGAWSGVGRDRDSASCSGDIYVILDMSKVLDTVMDAVQMQLWVRGY